MKKKLKFSCILLLSVVLLLTCAPAAAAQPEQAEKAGTNALCGMFIYTQNNTDFPSRPGLSQRQLKQEAQALVDCAVANGFTSILFEAVPATDAMYRSRVLPASSRFAKTEGAFTFADPLRLLIAAAEKSHLDVYAMISPYYAGEKDAVHSKKSPVLQTPQNVSVIGNAAYLSPRNEGIRTLYTDAAEELLNRYGVAGVLLDASRLPDTLDGKYDGLAQLAQDIAERTGIAPGVVLPGDHPDEKLREFVSRAAGESLVSLMIPVIKTPTNSVEQNYAELLAEWQTFSAGVPLATGHALELSGAVRSDFSGTASRFELNYQLMVDQIQQVSGSVFSGYRSLQNPLAFQAAARELSTMQGQTYEVPIDLAIPDTLAITRPSDSLKTTYEKYYIMGTSDPNLPLYLDGTEVENRAESGCFGVLVPLEIGVNTFNFTQGDAVQTATITRTVPTVSTTSKITSAYPTTDDLIFAQDGKVTLRCVAPSGGTVSAAFAGTTVSLQQQSAAQRGVPAVFSATVSLKGDYSEDETTLLGTVTYALRYNGVTSYVTSDGTLYLAGRTHTPSVTVSAFWGSVLKDPSVEGDYLTVLKQGASDYVVGSTSSHYQLASGGYLPKSQAAVNVGNDPIENHLSVLQGSYQEEYDLYTLPLAKHPPYHMQMDEEAQALTVTVFHATGLPDGELPQESTLFSSIESCTEDGNTTLTFHLAEGQTLWGSDILWEDGALTIYCKRKPQRSDDPLRPLQGIQILLDPGHGDYDPGALGVAGTTGATEKDLNLAAALVLKQRLESLGADVQMTREDDTFIELEARLAAVQNSQPDFFLSLHHNSTAETTDSSRVSGVEVYYHTDYSAAYAGYLLQNVSGETGRKANWYSQDYYRVTRSTAAPSALLEIGYLPNPTEYDDVCSRLQLYRTACGISQAILETLD